MMPMREGGAPAGAPLLRSIDGGRDPGPRRQGSRALRFALVGLDAFAAALAWALAARLGDLPHTPSLTAIPHQLAFVVASVVVTLGFLAGQQLYRSRVCSIRTVETMGLLRASVGTGLVLKAGFGAVTDENLPLSRAVVGAVASFLLLGIARAGYRSWLLSRRKVGRFTRPIVIVGSNYEGSELFRMLGDHPELGFTVAGVVGDPDMMRERGFEAPWLGHVKNTLAAVNKVGAQGVFIAPTAVTWRELNKLVRELLDAGVHVQLSGGLQGISYSRMKAMPLNREPVFYLETVSLSGWQSAIKRAVDVAGALVGLTIAAPVLLVAAIAIKLQDRGPVFFKQERVGRNGETFTIYKLRTMVVDAEARLAELAALNQRKGPLFKLSDDPRVTMIGRILRGTSIDELPQLINVLNGTMSLVGPRPALPGEVAEFDEELLCRHRVRPGITGLWQVEARDDTSFAAYQRRDIFYVENWSVGLDLTILFSTVKVVLLRALRSVTRRSAREAKDTATAVLD